MNVTERLTETMNVPLTPTIREQINALAAAEDRKPATMARRLILAGIAMQQQSFEKGAMTT